LANQTGKVCRCCPRQLCGSWFTVADLGGKKSSTSDLASRIKKRGRAAAGPTPFPMKTLLALFTLLAAVVSSGRAAETYRIAVIPKGTTHEFWKSINAGAVKAQRELAAEGVTVNIIWKGPLKEDDREQQIQVVENFIGQRVNAIVLAPLDRRGLVAPVETAAKARIPVVVIDSGIESKAPVSFVATDNREGGRIAGRNLGQLLGGKGNVMMLRYAVGSASTEEREEGFLEVMKKDFPNIKLLSVDQHAGPTRDTAKRVAETMLNRHGREVNGIFACNESSAVGMLLALRDAGLAGGKVKFVGFDSGETLNAALKAGDIAGLVVQNPLKMGYVGVRTAVAALQGKKVDPVIDTGVGFVTKANMNQPENAELLNPPLDKYLK
jgi:ribose transport system substrate-binding protein